MEENTIHHFKDEMEDASRSAADGWAFPAAGGLQALSRYPVSDAGSDWARMAPPRPHPAAPAPHPRLPALSMVTGEDATDGVIGPHLRAARALLGWAMADLARFSGLSMSTIRRMEHNAHAVSVRNHRSAVEALEAGGIRFLTLNDGTIALAERRTTVASVKAQRT